MDRLNRMLAGASGMGGLGAAPGSDNQNLIDNSETVYISSLALLKMLRHGRAGVPMEVMGLMLGEFVDDFTVRVVDVFAMPQSGTGVSVEAVDPVFQQKMMDMLTQTGRPESVVGWYHSHPGFGCWLSSVDINTQQSFEQLTPRAVAVVVDPIQSVKGKVVIDAFRLINPQSLMLGQEPRQSTSNLGHLNKPSIQALIHGLNRHYYSIGINYRKTALEENMLMNLHKHVWTEALMMEDFRQHGCQNKERFQRLVSLAEGYEKRVKEETELTKDQLKTRYVGKLDPKKHLEDVGQQLIEDNIVSVSRQMIDKEATMPKKDVASNGQANGDHMEVEDEELRWEDERPWSRGFGNEWLALNSLFFSRLRGSKKPTETASHRSDYYNAQLRSNLGMTERPPRLATIVGQPPLDITFQHQDSDMLNSDGNERTAATTLVPTATGEVAPRRPTPKGRGRFPTNPNNRATAAGTSVKPVWADTPMETAQLAELFGKLATLEHIPYALCGRAALVDHGLSTRKAKQVSILVPACSKEVVTGWAKSSGWVVSEGARGVFVGIPLSRAGDVRQLRVKYLEDDRFEQLERVRSRLSSAAWALSLTSQLDHLCAAWLDHLRQAQAATGTKSNNHTANGIKTKNSHEMPLQEIARDIFWTLDEMARSRTRPDPRFLPTLQGEEFFAAFTERYPKARVEMARAGVDVAAVLAGLRDRRALREHNEMLARYGAQPLVGDGDVAMAPFEGMRDLNHSNSVYTLATNLSVSEFGGGESSSIAGVRVPEPARIQQRESAWGLAPAPARRPRSVLVSGARPPPAVAVVSAAAGIRDSGRSLTRTASTRAAPPRTSLIPQADRRRNSTEWI
ncbi:hypothetical protein DL764_003418 [Monosporascus ibericus]|uniref:MPN domain-containing protein n=1 Tax=Monosporascus ibericus TaxID=155417 RepID=A0A4Q4TGQ6_9PEZI|nr:hypothetical protein DL764_003418 [Monosporascus ibericus]